MDSFSGMNRETVQQLLAEAGLSPNKRLGQNFLVSEWVRDRILEEIEPGNDDAILEIGPGLGVLTESMLDRGASVAAVEIDAGLCRLLHKRLGGRAGFTLVHGDFCRLEMEGGFTRVVSNLPYYCSSEILFKSAALAPRQIFVMVQREVGDRLSAAAGDPEYGALTASLGVSYRPATLFHVPRNAFFPRPDVASSFMCLSRRDDIPLDGDERRAYHEIVKAAFWGRRKTLRKALSSSPHIAMTPAEAEALCEGAGIDPGVRGEEIEIEEFARLARQFKGGEDGAVT